jgi:transposase
MARKARGRDLLEQAKAYLSKAKTAEELRQAQAVVMPLFLDEVSTRHLNDKIIMVLDGAGWHKSKSLMIPDNIRLLSLPPYSPELNPVEHIWDDLREKEFHNRVFDNLGMHLTEPHTTGCIMMIRISGGNTTRCRWFSQVHTPIRQY